MQIDVFSAQAVCFPPLGTALAGLSELDEVRIRYRVSNLELIQTSRPMNYTYRMCVSPRSPFRIATIRILPQA